MSNLSDYYREQFDNEPEEDEYVEVEESRSKMSREKIAIIVAGVVILILALGVGAGFYIKSRNTDDIETIVQKQIETYTTDLSTPEIQAITREVASRVNDSLANAGSRELTDDELQKLMNGVMAELSYTDYELSDEQIAALSSEIVKEVLKSVEKQTEGELDDVYSRIDELSSQLTVIDAQKSITQQDIQKLIEQYGLSEDDVVKILQDGNTTKLLVEQLSKELGIDTDAIYKAIAESKTYTDSVKTDLMNQLNINAKDIQTLGTTDTSLQSQIDLLSQKTGQSESSIYEKIANVSNLTDSEIQKLKDLLQKEIDGTDKDINEIINNITQMNSDLNALINQYQKIMDDTLSEYKSETDKSINDINNKLNNNITALEKATATKSELDAALKALQEAINANAADNTDDLQKQIDAAITKLNGAIEGSSADDAESLRKLREELQNIKDGNTSDINDINKTLDSVSESLGQQISNADAEIARLNNVITDLNSQISDLQNELADKITETNEYIDKTINKTKSEVSEKFDQTTSYIDQSIINQQTYTTNLKNQVQSYIQANDSHSKVDNIVNIVLDDWISSGSAYTATITSEYFVGCTSAQIYYHDQYNIDPTYIVDDVNGSLTISTPNNPGTVYVDSVVIYHITDENTVVDSTSSNSGSADDKDGADGGSGTDDSKEVPDDEKSE